LRVLVSDADWLNRARAIRVSGGSGGPEGLDQIIGMLNRERHNDRLTSDFSRRLLRCSGATGTAQRSLSQISIVDGNRAPAACKLRESLASESSIPLGGPSAESSLELPIR